MNLTKESFLIITFLVASYSANMLFAQHNHDHSGHDHSGHNHAQTEQVQTPDSHDDHSGHDHSGHDHSGHDHNGHDHSGHDHGVSSTDNHAAHTDPCGEHHHTAYDPTGTAIHHISDANVYTILEAVHIPLPCILWSEDAGWDFFSSGKFAAGHHEDGHYAYNGYVLHHGNVHRVTDTSFPQGKVEIGGFAHSTKMVDGKEKDIVSFCYNNKPYEAQPRSTLDGGYIGGGFTNFQDYSITKHVATMMIVALLLFFLFRTVAKRYAEREGMAPTGIQSLMETFVVFLRDEVAIPFIGEHKYEKYFSFLLSIFFFILGLNLWGQVPFFGSVNVSGTISVTLVLAVLVFIVVNVSGNKDYWAHVFWMPGVPTFVKPLLAVVEFMGLFIKPITLMLRLAGNITAGHIAILSFIGLIFIFGNSGESLVGGSIGVAMSIPLTLFMMAIEIIVAFVQAYVFTLLAASYIGAATEEHHH